MRYATLLTPSFVAATAILFCGCGGSDSGPPMVSVRGIVKYKDKPIAKLSVAFVPDKGMLASGVTDDQGRFTLTSKNPGDGAMAGNYKVAIRHVPDEIPEMQGLTNSDPPAPTSPIPPKFGDINTSGLTATVTKETAKKDFLFELTD